MNSANSYTTGSTRTGFEAGRRRVSCLSIVIEDNDGGYLARCPGIQGAFAEGDSIEEAVFNCIDVVKMIAAYRKERDEPLRASEFSFSPKTQLTIAMPVGLD
jgi:predicted RNase H-like HicB family nuclease